MGILQQCDVTGLGSKIPHKQSQVDQRTLDQGTVQRKPPNLHNCFHPWHYHDFTPSIANITNIGPKSNLEPQCND